MDEDRIPAAPGDIDADWLTRAMAPRHPGVKVSGVEVLETHEVTNTHARLQVTYDEPAGAPETMFAKMLPLDPRRRPLIARTDMGRREARFYASLAPQVSLRVPEAHVARHADEDGAFVLVLEDLAVSGCRVSDGTWGVAPDAAARALEDLADLHVRFEDPSRRAAEAPWVPEARHGSSYGADLLRFGLEHHRERLSDAFADIAEIYIAHAPRLHELWHTGPLTIIHGDPHIGNLFDDGGRTGLLDWGIINVSSPMRDVSYFLNMAMSIEDRRRHERDLLRHYLDVRQASGASPIDEDSAWHAHRLHAAYTVPACCQVVTFPEGASPRRRVFADAFLARAEAALQDLEAREALRRTAGL